MGRKTRKRRERRVARATEQRRPERSRLRSWWQAIVSSRPGAHQTLELIS